MHNIFKQVNLYFGNGSTMSTLDWKDALYIHRDINLFPENMTVEFSYTHDTFNVMDEVMSKGIGGVVQKVGQLLDAARVAVALGAGSSTTRDAAKNVAGDPGIFKSRYLNTPAWKGTSNIIMPSSMKFKFGYGQANLFNATQEVIKPVISLAAVNAPYEVGPNRFVGPVPTVAFFVGKFLKNFGGAAINTVKAGLVAAENAKRAAAKAKALAEVPTQEQIDNPTPAEEKKPLSNEERIAAIESDQQYKNIEAVSMFGTDNFYGAAINAATNLETEMVRAYDAAVTEALGTMRTFFFSIGNLQWGPCMIKDTKWGFDFTETDSDGAPLSGWVEFSGIQTLTMAEMTAVNNLARGYKSFYPGSSNPFSQSLTPPPVEKPEDAEKQLKTMSDRMEEYRRQINNVQ